MSHLRERKEKICLNCNAQLQGRYCHVCGQENIEPKESVWHLINHFFQDITHFDGKFFSSLWLLTSKPGFLTAEYVRGRRASYLNPVRMYIFTSAFFFLLFFTFLGKPDNFTKRSTINGKTLEQVAEMDSAGFASFTSDINRQDGRQALPMTRTEFKHYFDTALSNSIQRSAKGVRLSTPTYHSRAQYDSLLKKGAVKDNWLERKVTYQGIAMNEKYHGDNREAFSSLLEVFYHKLPQMFFVSLPLMALLLQLLYIRRKEFYYVSHGIFSLHLYIFVFIIMLLSLVVGMINNHLDWPLLNLVRFILVLLIFGHLCIAMKRFYGQGWLKTIIKFIILSVLFLALIGTLFLVYLLLAFFSI